MFFADTRCKVNISCMLCNPWPRGVYLFVFFFLHPAISSVYHISLKESNCSSFCAK